MTSKVKVVSWNILASEWIRTTDYPDIKTSLLFSIKRINKIIETLQNYNADIVFLQEVMPNEYKIIKKKFKDKYTITQIQPIKWSYKNESHTKNESGNVILIRNTNYHTIKVSVMDFCIIVQCIHNETNKTITLYNIHLDDISSVKRNTQMQKLLDFDNDINKKNKNACCIIGGDFNQKYTLKSKLYSLPKFIVHNLCNTYYIDSKLNIDNILTRGFKVDKTNSKCVNVSTNNEDMFKKIGSDHISIIASLLI